MAEKNTEMVSVRLPKETIKVLDELSGVLDLDRTRTARFVLTAALNNRQFVTDAAAARTSLMVAQFERLARRS